MSPEVSPVSAETTLGSFGGLANLEDLKQANCKFVWEKRHTQVILIMWSKRVQSLANSDILFMLEPFQVLVAVVHFDTVMTSF